MILKFNRKSSDFIGGFFLAAGPNMGLYHWCIPKELPQKTINGYLIFL